MQMYETVSGLDPLALFSLFVSHHWYCNFGGQVEQKYKHKKKTKKKPN